MAGQRDRILKIINYLESLGIEVNIGKNKARGNKGFFKTNNNSYRIDISKGLSEEETLRVLVHELAHYVHYCEDKTLKSLNFIFGKDYENFQEDLISLTVDAVPKDFANKLFDIRDSIKNEINDISKQIKAFYPDIRLSQDNNKIAKDISKSEYKYLLKYDKVRVFSGFRNKVYSIENLRKEFPDIKPEHERYLQLNSLKRKLRRINSRISRLNRYYNKPSELFARSMEYFILKPECMKHETPKLYEYYKQHRDVLGTITNAII